MKFAVAALLGTTSAYEAMRAREYEFMSFIAKHGKSYGTKAEYNFRMELFEKFADEVDQFNSMGLNSVHEVNKFADLTMDERRKFLTGYIQVEDNKPAKVLNASNAEPIDWRTQGAVTDVKDQGQCGSCWSFSTTGTIEGAEAIAGNGLNVLSEQQFVDCNTIINKGCNGGSMAVALMYAAKHQVELEADYPYTAKDGTCSYDQSKTVTNVSAHENVTPKDADQFKAALQVGPVSIAIEADQTYFQSYKSGTLDQPSSCGEQLDHGVLAVGWGTNDKGENYVIVKNSWSPTWGDAGYVNLDLDNNTCGLMDQPLYAVSTKK